MVLGEAQLAVAHIPVDFDIRQHITVDPKEDLPAEMPFWRLEFTYELWWAKVRIGESPAKCLVVHLDLQYSVEEDTWKVLYCP